MRPASRSTSDAGLDQRQQRDPSRARARRSPAPDATSVTRPSRAALLLDREADELERVVLALAGSAAARSRDLELASPRAASRSSRITGRPAGALRLDDPRRLAVDEQRRAPAKRSGSSLALLDDERAVEPVRLADPPDLDSHARRLEQGDRVGSRRSRADVLGDERLGLGPAGARGSRPPRARRRTPCGAARRRGDERPERGDVALVRPPDRARR